MNVTKYADLSQSLAESEKQLYDKISEECASNFEIAIQDSIKKIERNADSMTEVVDKIQSCKDSYGEAAELVEKLSTTLADTEKNVMGLNAELVQLSETTGNSTSDLLGKVSELLVLSDNLIVKNKENEIVIEDTCKNIQKLEEEYMSCVNDVKSCTAEYVETIQKVNSSLLESFNVFKNDFLSTYDEQSRMIGELKEEQIKLKKLYMLGIIPTIIIVVLQIVNIIC